jgi:hypothetical protein
MLTCQRSNVHGETIRRSWLRCLLRISRASADRIARPAQEDSGCIDVALEHGDLVAQDQNLGVFGQL